MWPLRISLSLLLVALACAASGCVTRPYYCAPYQPTALSPRVSDEIARCEATGMSYADCCDSHPDECE